MKITIPRSIEEAQVSLGGLGQLLTAKQWERAAIVYAFTELAEGGRGKTTGISGRFSCAAFARIGIAGLRDEETVTWVRQAWQDAIEDGQAQPVEPGIAVELPDRDFPKHPRTRSGVDGFKAQLRQRTDVVAELVHDDPDIAVRLAAQVLTTPTVRRIVEARLTEPIHPREIATVEPRHVDYAADLTYGINLLIPVLRAIQRGEWQPDTTHTLLLHSLGLLLAQAAQADAEPEEDLFNDIAKYLSEAAPR